MDPLQARTISSDVVVTALSRLSQQPEDLQIGRFKVGMISMDDSVGIVLTGDKMKELATASGASQVLKLYQDGSYWSSRDLFFVDNVGVLKAAYKFFSSAEQGNSLTRLETVDAQRQFQGAVCGIARSLGISVI